MELELIKYGGYLLSGILGWFVRVLWTAQDQMRKDFSELEKNLPIVYVRQDDFRAVIRDVKDSFKEAIYPVLNKLDRWEEKWEKEWKEHKEYIENTYQRK